MLNAGDIVQIVNSQERYRSTERFKSLILQHYDWSDGPVLEKFAIVLAVLKHPDVPSTDVIITAINGGDEVIAVTSRALRKRFGIGETVRVHVAHSRARFGSVVGASNRKTAFVVVIRENVTNNLFEARVTDVRVDAGRYDRDADRHQLPTFRMSSLVEASKFRVADSAFGSRTFAIGAMRTVQFVHDHAIDDCDQQETINKVLKCETNCDL